MGRKNWMPTEYSWIYSAHFLSGEKSNDPLSTDYVPSVLAHTKSPLKRKLAKDMERFERASSAKKRRIENTDRQTEEMEADRQKLLICNQDVMKENEQQKRENSKLISNVLLQRMNSRV